MNVRGSEKVWGDMGLFKRKRKRSSRPARRIPRRELAPVEEIVEQGLMVADVATRMTVKNAIILNALRHKVDYDQDQIRDLVHDSVTELAEERDRDARHIEHMRAEIRRTGRSLWSENEYGNDDNRTLRHRQEVYERVAEELMLRAADPAYLNEAAERARLAAWHEIGDSLKEKASHPYYAGGSSKEYQQARESRIQQLIEKDLTSLVKSARTKADRSSEDQEDGASAKPQRSRKKLIGKKKV